MRYLQQSSEPFPCMHIRKRLAFTTKLASHRIRFSIHPPTAHSSRADEPSQHTSSFTLLPVFHSSQPQPIPPTSPPISPSLPLSLSPSLPPSPYLSHLSHLSPSLSPLTISHHPSSTIKPLTHSLISTQLIRPSSLFPHPQFQPSPLIHPPPTTYRSANPHSPLHVSIFPSFHPSIFPSFHLSILPPFHLSIFPALHLSIFPSFYLSIFPSFHLSIFPSFHLSIFPSLHPPPSQQQHAHNSAYG